MKLKVNELKAICNNGKLDTWKLVDRTMTVEMGEHSYFDIIIKKGRKKYMVCLKQKWFDSDSYDSEEISLIEL